MDFKRILHPYRKGGTENHPVNRTMGTIIDYLVNKKGYPIEIVGGAIFLVFNWIESGGEFKGTGKYGSKGKELVTSIRIKCDDLLRERIESETYKMFLEYYGMQLRETVIPLWKRRLINWWTGRKIYNVTS